MEQPKGTIPVAAGGDKIHRPPPSLHPLPDPVLLQPTAIQNISHRFSRLYAANRRRIGLKPYPHPHPYPQPESEDFTAKSCTALTKSSSQHERKTKIKDKPKPSKKKSTETQLTILKAFEMEREAPETRISTSSSSSSNPLMLPIGRRSFCSSQIELGDFFSSSGAKTVAVDMPPFMQIHAVDCARKAHDSLEKFTSKTLALTIKKEFDGVYGPAWHCIVGTSFGSFVTHSVGGFIYFSLDRKLHILLFKTTVQRAED